MKYLIVIFGALFILAGPAFSETAGSGDDDLKKVFLYEWKDDKGDAHIADSLGKVPERYRSKVRKLESVKGPEIDPGSQGYGGKGYSSSLYSDDAEGKANWQRRITSWKSQLSGAEARYRELERERSELFRAWGSAALAPIEKRLRAEQIDQELKEVQKEIDEAKEMINRVIPEEARKAGVPPGWLRD